MTDGTPGAAPIEAALGALLPPGAVGVVWTMDGQAPDGLDEMLERVPPREHGLPVEGGLPAWDGPSAERGLAPEELAAIRNAVPSRRREFARGRACAREALRRLGHVSEPIVIPVGPSREPVWPVGVTGSITHCEGLVAAVVARVGTVASIGVDAEPARPLPPGVRDVVLTPAERARHTPDDLMETVSFSAKEAIHKAIHPATGVWLDFQDVELTFDVERGGFRAFVAGDAAAAAGSPVSGPSLGVGRLAGRYAILAGFLVTVAYLPG